MVILAIDVFGWYVQQESKKVLIIHAENKFYISRKKLKSDELIFLPFFNSDFETLAIEIVYDQIKVNSLHLRHSDFEYTQCQVL